MKQLLLYTFLLALLQGVGINNALSQKSSEEELKEANKLFEDGKYKEAAPLFLKKLSVDQKNPEYNFKYGACVLYSEGDKKQGLKYLKFASQAAGVDSRVWFHLGKAYHLNYMFSDAVKAYDKFILLNPKEKDKYQVQKEIDACNYGKKLLKTITEVQVVSRKEFTENNFFYAYKLEGIGGQMALINSLQSDLDKKKNHNVIVYFPDKKSINTTIFYASYGKEGKSGKDIYKVNRLPDGSFGQPQIINGPVNTSFDEDFPYMHPDGKTFYFASKGHNSMGGYDIFRCYYDEDNNTFSAPENVDFAINTPGDDILFVTDSLERLAFFASTRESPSGKINVYNVFVDRLPINIAIVKGNFINEINETYLSANITIEDVATGEVVGIYNTNRNTGSYLITLPKGGKYKFSVIGESQKIHSGIVDIPPSKELKPLKQELVLTKEDGQEILKIRNLFDEEFDNVDEILAEVFLGAQKLDPNADPNDTTGRSGDGTSDNLDIKADEDVLAVAKKDADQLQKDYEEAKLKMEGAYAFAAKKQKDAKEKSDKANDLLKEAAQTTNEDEKAQLIAAANELNEEAAKDNAMAVSGYNLGKGLEADVEQKKKDADIAREFEKGIEKAVNAKNHNEVIAELKKQQEFVKSVMGPDSEKRDNEDQLRTQAAEKKKEVDKIKQRMDDLYETESDLKKEIAKLEDELKNPNTKKDRKKEIEGLLPQKRQELSDTQGQLAANDKKYKQLIGEQKEIDQQLAVITGITDGGPSLTQAEKDKLAKDISNNDVAATIEKNNNDIKSQQDINRAEREKTQQFLAENSNYDELNRRKEEASRNPDKKIGLTEEKKINEEIIKELDKADADLEKKLKTETDPEKKKEIEAQRSEVKKIKEETVAENVKLEKDIASVGNPDVELTKERKNQLTNVTLPGYDQQLNKINTSGDPDKEKLADKVDLNDNVIRNADTRIREIDKILQTLSGEDKKQLEKEKAELTKLKDELEAENENHEKEIARIEKEEQATASTNPVSENKFTEDEKDKITEIDPGYKEKTDAIKNSDKTEIRKDFETVEANKDLVKRIEEKEAKIKTDNTLTEKEKSGQLAELDKLKEKTEKEIKAGEEKLGKNGVNTNPVELTEVKSTDYTDPNAKKEAAIVEKKMDAIEVKENNLDKLYVEAGETTDQKKKDDLEKKIATEEKSYFNDINKVAPEIEKINSAEFNKTDQETEKAKKDLFKKGNPDENNPIYQNAVEAEKKADQEKKEAEALRTQAKSETDPEKKAGLNALAAEKEKAAIEGSKDAKRMYDAYRNEMPVATEVTAGNISEEKKEVIAGVDPEYVKELAAIEGSVDSKEEKNLRKNDLNQDLVKEIEKEELKVKSDFTLTEEEKKKKLDALNSLKNETNREIEKTNDELKESGVKDTRSSDVKYESISFDDPEANKEIEDVKKDLTSIDQLKKDADEARENYIASKDEDEKLQKLAKANMDKKDLELAKKEIAVSDDLKAGNDKEWTKLNDEYNDKKEMASSRFNANDDRKKMADELEQEAINDRKEAEQLRKEASAEKDPLIKADKLRQAYELEKGANDKLKVASDLMDESMAEAMAASVTKTEKDTEGNVIIPEKKEDRNSSQARELAADEMRISDSLNKEAAEYEKKAEKGNKKSKAENKAKAEELRSEAKTHEEIANSLYKKANEEEKKEDQIFAEQTKRREEEEIRNTKKEEVKTLPEYVQYYDLKKRADEKKALGDKAKADAEQQQMIADNTREEAEDTRDKANSETDATRKEQLVKTAFDLDKKANNAERKADSLNRVAEKYYVESSGFNWDVENFLKKIDSQKAEDIRLATADGKLPDPDRSVVAVSNPADPDFIIPAVVNTDVFAKVEKSVYSDENPIPINPKTPSGPYLKVQVGAFRNPIKQSLYKDFAPVTGEARGDGLTRYTVGYFTTLESAIKARDEIRAMGYRDAFIVGFDDGNRTTVANAVAKLKGGTTDVALNGNPTNPVNPVNPVNPTNPSNEDLVKKFEVDEKKDDYYTGVPNAAKANQIEVIQGLFYTVQVGVYSKPVTPDKIFNLTPLNSELITRNNWIRYTTGIYKDFGKADTRKEQIRTIGVKDAFVVAYINGNKITPEKANELLKQYGDSILVKLDANGNPVKGSASSAGNTLNDGGNQVTPTNDTQKYKVILGEYMGEVPVGEAEIYIRNPNEGIQRKTDANGKTVFYIENISGKTNAEKTVQKFKDKGLKNARIDDGTALSNNSVTPTNPDNEPARTLKNVEGLVFQVYLGEYVNELPEHVTKIILDNMSKGIKRKESPSKNTIYYTGDFKSYDEAMKEKAYFFIEGITDVKVVPLYNTKEISVNEALNLMYE